MPLCVTLHGYRCGVDTLALEVLYYIDLFRRNSEFWVREIAIYVFCILSRYRVESCRSRVDTGRDRVGLSISSCLFDLLSFCCRHL